MQKLARKKLILPPTVTGRAGKRARVDDVVSAPVSRPAPVPVPVPVPLIPEPVTTVASVATVASVTSAAPAARSRSRTASRPKARSKAARAIARENSRLRNLARKSSAAVLAAVPAAVPAPAPVPVPVPVLVPVSVPEAAPELVPTASASASASASAFASAPALEPAPEAQPAPTVPARHNDPQRPGIAYGGAAALDMRVTPCLTPLSLRCDVPSEAHLDIVCFDAKAALLVPIIVQLWETGKLKPSSALLELHLWTSRLFHRIMLAEKWPLPPLLAEQCAQLSRGARIVVTKAGSAEFPCAHGLAVALWHRMRLGRFVALALDMRNREMDSVRIKPALEHVLNWHPCSTPPPPPKQFTSPVGFTCFTRAVTGLTSPPHVCVNQPVTQAAAALLRTTLPPFTPSFMHSIARNEAGDVCDVLGPVLEALPAAPDLDDKGVMQLLPDDANALVSRALTHVLAACTAATPREGAGALQPIADAIALNMFLLATDYCVVVFFKMLRAAQFNAMNGV